MGELKGLNGNELEEIEDQLKPGFTLCQQTPKEYEVTLSLIPYSLPSYSPLPSVKDKLFQKIRATKSIGQKPYPTSFRERLHIPLPRLAAGIALAMLILLAGSNLSLRNRLSEQQIEKSGPKVQVMRKNDMMDFLQNPIVVTINLVALIQTHKLGEEYYGIKKDNKALVHDLNLPPIPPLKNISIMDNC